MLIPMILGGLYLLSPFLYLPWVRFGYYHQSEPVTYTAWALSAFVALWMAWHWKRRCDLFITLFRHPVVWTQFLVGGVSLLTLPFHTYPLLTLTGSPQLGYGGLHFFAQGFMVALLLLLVRNRQIKMVLTLSAAALGLGIGALTALFSSESPIKEWRYAEWAPYFFNDFLGHIGLVLLVFIAVQPRSFYRKHLWILPPIAALMGAFLYFASSKSFGIGIILGSLLSILLMSARSMGWLSRSFTHDKLFPSLIVLGIVGITLGLLIFPYLIHAFPSFAKLESLLSRTFMIKSTFVHFFEGWDWAHIKDLMCGRGWGRFIDLCYENLFLMDQSVQVYQGDSWKASEYIARDMLHTHNIAGEHFLGTGLVGIAAMLYAQWNIAWGLSRSRWGVGVFFITALAVMNSLWFAVPTVFPFVNLAYALLAGRLSRRPRRVAWIRPALIGYALLAISVASAVGWHATYVRRYGTIDSIEAAEKSFQALQTPWGLPFEQHLAAKRCCALMRHETGACLIMLSDETAEEGDAERVYHLGMQQADNMLKSYRSRGSVYLLLAVLNTYGEMALHPKLAPFFKNDPGRLKKWRQAVLMLTELTPHRSDMTQGLFAYYLFNNRPLDVLSLSREILQRDPNSPVALWFSGAVKMQNPMQREQGIRELKLALKNKIQRVMPIPKERLEYIQSL